MKFFDHPLKISFSHLQSPPAYMLLAVFSVSLSSFFAKLSIIDIGVHATIFVRFFIPLLLSMPLLFIFKPSIKLQMSSIKLTLLRAFSLIFSQLCLFLAIQGLPLAEAILLYNTGPIIITLFSFLLGYKVKTKECIGLALGVVGILFICRLQEGTLDKYVLYGVLSSIAFSISQITLYASSKKEDSVVIMFYLYLFTSLLAFILHLTFSDETLLTVSNFEYPIVIFLFSVGFFSLLNQYFRGKAYKKSKSPSELAPLIYFSVLFSSVLDLVFFSIAPDTQSIVGCVLIFLSTYMTIRNTFKESEK